MTTRDPQEITTLLSAWTGGDHAALDRLISLIYPELRRIARRHLARAPFDHSLESAALANEAYLKLVKVKDIHFENRSHFFALCAQMIRRILVDEVRKRKNAKRGQGAVHVPIEEAVLGTSARGVELVALDDALEALSRFDARKARVVEMRFFGGLSVSETADVLGVSPETVMRDWKLGKVWLFRELNRGKLTRTSSAPAE